MERSRAIWKFVFCLCVTLLCGSLAHAQYQATVQGTVLDPKGAAVGGATVTLMNQDTKVTNTTTTTNVGFYHFAEVPPGTYTVTAEQTGFQKKVVSDVAVSAEIPRGLDITLDIGQVAQTVTVNASSTPDLQTEESNIEGTLTNQEVERLPSFGRDPYELLRLSPGVLGDGARSGIGQSVGFPNGPGANGGTGGPGGSNTAIYQTENQQPISANGQRVTSNDYMIDGVSVDSLQWGGAAVVTPSVESVQEISVLANDYDVADGRDSGAHVKVTTKSGTDVFHGATFFQYQTPGLNAYNKYNGYNFGNHTFDPTVRDENNYRQFGANLGGPIMKDKLFFFFNYEGLRDTNTVFSDQWVDTPQFRQLLIGYSPNTPVATTLSDPGIAPRIQEVLPSSCAAFPVPCQVVSGGVNIGSPTGTYGTYLPNNEVQSGGGLTSVPEFEFAELYLPASTQGNQYNARVDYNLGRSVFSVNVFLTQFNNTSADAGAQGRPMADYNSKRFTPSGFLGWIFNISPTMVNEARFNFTRWSFNDITANPQIDWAIPRTEIQNAVPGGQRIVFGAAQGDNSPGIYAENTFAFRDVVSKTHGQHVTRVGFEFNRFQNNDDLLGGARPDIVFQQPWNFAVGTAIFEALDVNPATGGAPSLARAYRTSDYGIFIADDWKFRSNLTFNIGVRWEYYAPPTDADHHLANIVPSPIPGLGLQEAIATNPTQMYSPDYHNFAPRLGFAWSPQIMNGKGVVRGGFGMAFDRFDNVSFDNTRDNPPFVANYGLCCGGPGTPTPPVDAQIRYVLGTNPASPLSFPANPALATGINPVSNLPIILPGQGAPNVYANSQTFNNPYIYLYSLDLQYALPKNWVATIGYQGSSSHGLLRIRNLQYFYPTPNPLIGAVFEYTPDTNANFNALNAELKRTFRAGLLIDVLYTYSKSIDEVSSEGPGFGTNQTYPTDDATERGPSDYDTPHNLRIAGLWDLPILRNHHDMAGNILGGWELNGDFQFHSGFPWTPVASNNCNLVLGSATICPIRPIGILAEPGNDASTSAFLPPTNSNFAMGGPAYYNVTASGFPAIGRNSERGPRFSQFDFSFVKNFGLPKMKFVGENSKIQLRMNVYNAFNKLNLAPFTFGSTSTTVSYGNNGTTPIANPQFGTASTGLAGRTIELEGRFVF
ncbi:MAG TPA: TonB-dependent receptor [Candidatus Acidoferrales bacterium]|nr:TonB-dependent receptor [Candidatus Acidoferrales bacterium]